ncbi:MAG: hypothetical protein K6D97_06050 [Clostridia bacterium]|nr:hypothetical protein [Clostridia bacterium]
MKFHRFVVMCMIFFLILGVAFYALIESGVLESEEVQNITHFFDKKENVESQETVENNETEVSIGSDTEEKTDETEVVEVVSE